MANRTPQNQWGALFNFAGGGIVHNELFVLILMSALNPTLFETIANYLLPFGTHAARPAVTNTPLNSFYFETDTQDLFQNQSNTWVQIGTVTGGGGTGDVVGPASATDSVPALFDGTTGKLIKNSTPTGTGNPVLASSPTIVTPTVASFANAPHSHADAAGGATLGAAAIASGTIATARLGSGTANSTTFLRGDQTWAAPAGSTPGLTLIQKQLMTGNVTTITFSSLDGNTTEIYRLIGRIKSNAASTQIRVRPNGATTNLTIEKVGSFTGNTFNESYANWVMCDNMGSGDYVTFDATIMAKCNPNSVAVPRFIEGGTSEYKGTTLAHTHFGGRWNETSTNITSLEVFASQTNGIANGSTVALYAYAQS